MSEHPRRDFVRGALAAALALPFSGVCVTDTFKRLLLNAANLVPPALRAVPARGEARRPDASEGQAWQANFRFQTSDLRFQISDLKSEINFIPAS